VRKALGHPVVWLAASSTAALLMVALFIVKAVSLHAAAQSPAPAADGLRADIVIPPKSMVAPDFTLTDQSGRPITVSGLRGRVLAITFLDSHCKQLCPIEADQLAQVQRSLPGSLPVSLLVVSVAPATDTAESERTFAAEHHWSGDWHWLGGNQSQLAAAWKAYSVAVQPSPDDILHSAVLYLVDKKGFTRAGFAAGLDPGRVAQDVRLLEREAS
jgi:cytochrome oxidase Cu insertion factor (SCO1/SenC/PrrC family)